MKNASSETDTSDDDLCDFDLSLPLPALGGGVTHTSAPSEGPLETVTGEPPRMTWVANPSPGRAPRARLSADANSSSRSVNELVRLNEPIRPGAMTLGSPCWYTYP